jgi:hypothetical protein
VAGMDINGRIIHSQPMQVRFSIIKGNAYGEVVYQEEHATHTDHNGLFSVVIGHGNSTALSPNASIMEVGWGSEPHFLKVEVDVRGRNDYKLMGIQQMMAVPYALYALESGSSKANDTQSIRISNDTLYHGDGAFVIIPEGFSGNYADLSGTPDLSAYLTEEEQVLSISNDTIFLTGGSFVKLPEYEEQVLSISNDTLYLNNSSFVILPDTVSYAHEAEKTMKADTAEYALLSDHANTFNKIAIRTTEECNEDNKGVMRYNESSNAVEYCNGSNWLILGAGTVVNVPSITTVAIELITSNSARSGGEILDNGGGEIFQHGLCWDTLSEPTINRYLEKTMLGTGGLSFVSNLTGLNDNTKYYTRSYGTNTAGTGYGNELDFTTLAPLSTTSVSGNTLTAFETGGDISVSGGEAITARGVAYNTTGMPTTSDAITTDGTGTGLFTSSISGLPNNTKYYIRAYATNAGGTNYGSQVTTATLAALSTADQSGATLTSVTGGGDIEAGGGASIFARGIAYGSSENPDISGTKITAGTGTGSFSPTASGLANNTLYHYRAYATNEGGTNYGTDKTATTLAALSTTSASDNTLTAFETGGDISVGGGEAIIVRGVAYNTSGTPTTSDAITTDGTGTGLFTSSISGLPNNTKYYIRAYATNAGGTNYGSQVTTATLAALSTADQSGATLTSVTGGGDIEAGGGASIFARGIAYGSSENPDISGTKITAGTGTGSFSPTASGLANNTLYHYRAYATNEGGTNYGTDKTATTLANVSATDDATFISYTSFSTGGTVDVGGDETILERGIVYGTSTNPTKSDNYESAASSGTGSFTVTISSLSPEANYYYRSYAINAGGISYGPQDFFRKTVNFNGALYVYPVDNSTGIQWYNGSYTTTNATSATDGRANTDSIVKYQGEGAYAAYLCDTLNAYGYDDWYLPAKDELNALYDNRASIGGFSSNYYWSSTESSSNYACIQYFDNGNQATNFKIVNYRIRCVRKD